MLISVIVCTRTCCNYRIAGSVAAEMSNLRSVIASYLKRDRPGYSGDRTRTVYGIRGSSLCIAAPRQRHKNETQHQMPMTPELIDDHVSVKQCKRAVTALMEYALKQQQKREENELLPGKEEFIWLQISVKRVHGEAKLKPRRMCVNVHLCASSCLYTG